ncbi:MAG: glycosyltransferase family 2 protein [Acidobacteria bacterium]|nr:glycosyltransferase family 2 protein [Acidobacteriota bacterium]
MLARSKVQLTVILPVYGNWTDTLATLGCLAVQDCDGFRVLVADDGSPTEAPEELHGFGFVEYSRGSNLGFAGNCNRAAGLAIAGGATHLLFLNNDTEVGEGFIGGWLRFIEKRPESIASAHIYWFDRPGEVWFSGGRFDLLTPFVRLAREYQEDTEVDIVCGCALLVPILSWERLVGFDLAYAVYFEDFDFSLRARSLGLDVVVAADPELKVRHKISGSFRGTGAWKQQYFLLASRIRFIRRYYPAYLQPLVYLLVVAHLGGVYLLNVPQYPTPRLLWRAVREGMAGA